MSQPEDLRVGDGDELRQHFTARFVRLQEIDAGLEQGPVSREKRWLIRRSLYSTWLDLERFNTVTG